MDDIVVIYNGEQISVSREVADYLEEERKREEAEKKRNMEKGEG